MKRKIITVALMMILTLSLLPVTSSASIAGKVTADNVRLRAQASTDSKMITLISINEQVDVIEKEGDWYKIKYKDSTGYVKVEFVKLQEDTEVTETKTTQEETVKAETETKNTDVTGEVTVSDIEQLYILPLVNSKVITAVDASTNLKILQSVNGWSYVTTGELFGWIRTDKLVAKQADQQETKQEETQQEETEKEEQQEELNKTGYISASSVNFRKEPSKSAEVIDALTINTEVTILAEEEGWYKIKVKNQTGYVAKDLVSDKKVEVTSRSASTARTAAQEAAVVPTDSSSSELGQQIANYALGFVGYPYVYGGSTPSGFDCSGFTSYVYKQFGYTISRSSSAQASNGVAVDKANLQPGDLVLFKGTNSSSIGHVGIYIGGGQFVHASTEKTGVKISSLSSSGYIARYVTARRIVN